MLRSRIVDWDFLVLKVGVAVLWIATIDRMVAEGMPSVTWGQRTRRLLPSTAIAWAANRGMS